MSTLAFDASASQDKETISLQELNDFLEHPHSIGLDNVKESLRNVVQYMMELKGYGTGFSLQILTLGEHPSMASMGLLKDDAKKKQALEDLWKAFLEELSEIARLVSITFQAIKSSAVTHIVNIQEDIIEQIDAIDAVIVAKASNEVEAQVMRKNNKKLKKLVSFKEQIKDKKADLLKADSSEEVLEIHQNIVEDVQDFKDEQFHSNISHPAPLNSLGRAIKQTQVQNDANYNISGEFKTSKNKTGSASESGDSDSGKQGDNTNPPPPTIEV